MYITLSHLLRLNNPSIAQMIALHQHDQLAQQASQLNLNQNRLLASAAL